MRRATVAALLGVLAACAGVRPYANVAAGNLTVRSAIDPGVRASLHVHQVDANCRTEYQGSLALDKPAFEVGLPAGRRTYLVVSFDSASFLAGSRTASVGTYFVPRAGYHYHLTVTYRDSIYDVALREADRQGARREIARRDLRHCDTL